MSAEPTKAICPECGTSVTIEELETFGGMCEFCAEEEYDR